MTARREGGGFASRPRDEDARIKTPDHGIGASPASDLYTARLTVDITPALRGPRQDPAFQRGETVADMAHARCSRANSPTSMEAIHEDRSRHRARAPP
jgi:hypothetical protein